MNIKQLIFSPSIIIFLGALIVALGGLVAAVQNGAKNEEITRLNKYILSSITGGDSFCYLALASINSTNNNALLSAVSQGEYPLYDVGFRIVDLEEFDRIRENITYEAIQGTQKIINIGNLPPGTAAGFTNVNLGAGDTKRYNIFVSARNGSFTQLLRLRRVNGEWKIATKVEKRDKEDPNRVTVIHESINEDYPRNERGEVEW